MRRLPELSHRPSALCKQPKMTVTSEQITLHSVLSLFGHDMLCETVISVIIIFAHFALSVLFAAPNGAVLDRKEIDA